MRERYREREREKQKKKYIERERGRGREGEGPVPSRLHAAAPGNALRMVGLCSGFVWSLAEGLMIRLVLDKYLDYVLFVFGLKKRQSAGTDPPGSSVSCLILFGCSSGGGWGGGGTSGCLGASLLPVSSMGVWGCRPAKV